MPRTDEGLTNSAPPSILASMPELSANDYATTIRRLRQHLGQSQQAFAVTLGVSVDTVRKWEQGISKPSHMALEKIDRLVRQLKKTANKGE